MHIVANWKQYLSPEQEILLTKEILTDEDLCQDHQLTLLPSYLSIREIAEYYNSVHTKSSIQLGIQDLAASLTPAQTGGIRADFIKTNTVLVGHSEREKLNHETTEDFGQKLQVAMRLKKKVLLCFGEKMLLDDDQALLQHLKSQLLTYSNLLGADTAHVTLAYEPQWSIGATKTASPTIIKKVLVLAQTFGFREMLYGGSVDANNIKQLYFPELAGFLIGRASTTFSSLVAVFTSLKELTS